MDVRAPDATDPDLDATDDGVELTWPSAHVSGPWDPDELALLEEKGALP